MFRLSVINAEKFKPLQLTIIRGLALNQKNAETASTQQHYDVIVAGGGLVGTTMACSLGKNKLFSEKNVLLLEGAPKFKGFAGGEYGNRVSALNRGTVSLLKAIGAWEVIAGARYKPVKQFHVRDASSHALITFNEENFAGDMAYIIENDLVLHAVYEQVEKLPNVQVKYQAKIEDVKLPGNEMKKSQVILANGSSITCDLLIGADGVNSLVRKRMNIEPYTSDYKQLGLVATLDLCDTGDNSVAWQRFLPSGTIAMLPLTDTSSSLVWCTTPSHAKELQQMPPQEFIDAVNDAFYKEFPKDEFTQTVLNVFEKVLNFGANSVRQYPPAVIGVKEKSRAYFPLGFGHAPSYVTRGAVLIGDAAHRIHPLAGQGVNLGFGDVKCLTEILADAVYSGFQIGDKQPLLKYERERLMNNFPIIFGIHGLQKLYSTTFSPVVMLRSLGLQITQNVPPLKKLFVQQAMG